MSPNNSSPALTGDVVLRPVREEDVEALYRLTSDAPDPITTLSPNRGYLTRRVHHSLRSFYPVIDRPGDESYLFVIENLSSGEILGASGISARVGGYEPFYTYKIRETQLCHEALNITKTLQELHLKLDHDGPSEIGSLFLHPDARGKGLGLLLSLSRFLFVARFPERFGTEVIAELRGVCDEQSRSPFWDAVGSHFFGSDYMTADQLSAQADKSFLRDLMPRHPIYVPLLPEAAREVIGEVHANTRPALGMLRQQGFEFINEVDIFDAGPVYKAATSDIKVVRNSRLTTVSGTEPPESAEQTPALLARADLDFRCVRCSITLGPDGSVCASQSTMDTLNLKLGDPVIYLEL